jgi:hypothetical protein
LTTDRPITKRPRFLETSTEKMRSNPHSHWEILSGRNETILPAVFCSAITLAAIGLLTGCPPGSHTYYCSLSPSQDFQDCWSKSAQQGYCFDLTKWGGACESVHGQVIPPNTVQVLGNTFINPSGTPLGNLYEPPTVGFTHKFYPGTQPFPCTEVYMWRSRAYVSFDLSKVDPKIESLAIATLAWEPATKRYEEGWAESKNIPPHCFRQLYLATGPLKSFDTPGDLVADLDENWIGAPPQKITITPAVKKVLLAGGSRLHFYFTGSDEGEYGQENRSCNTTLNSLTLNLTYAAK